MAASRAVPSPQLDELETLLRDLVQDMAPATGAARGRPPILPALML